MKRIRIILSIFAFAVFVFSGNALAKRDTGLAPEDPGVWVNCYCNELDHCRASGDGNFCYRHRPNKGACSDRDHDCQPPPG